MLHVKRHRKSVDFFAWTYFQVFKLIWWLHDFDHTHTWRAPASLNCLAMEANLAEETWQCNCQNVGYAI